MSYHLRALAPCTVLVSGASYHVEAGDPLHLSDADAQQILSGPYRARFAIISQDDPVDAASIADQSEPPNPAFFSNGTLPTVSFDDLHAPEPSFENELKASTELPPLGSPVDEVASSYKEFEKDGEAFLDELNKTPKEKKTTARRRTVVKTEPEPEEKG